MPKTFLKFCLLFLAIIAVYWNHFDNEFHFDDSHTIVNNPFIRELSYIPSYFTDSTTFSSLPANRSYRPLLTTTLAIDYYLGAGYNLFFFHLSTFILFLLQLIFQFFFYKFLLEQIGQNKNASNLSFLAVAIYGLHPVSAETVNYIIQRGDLHSTLGVVAGLVCYFYFPKLRKFPIYLLPVILGALSKPPAIMFAPILFSYIYLIENSASLNFWKKDNRLIFARSVLKTLPAILVCTFLYLLQARLTASSWTPGGSSSLNYIMTQPYVWLYYLKSFFLPTGLHIDIELATFTDWTSLNAVLGYCLVLFVIVYTYLQSFSKEGRLISFLILWCFFTLAPTSFIPLAETVNDHRMFFPYVALSLLICFLVKSFWEQKLAIFTTHFPPKFWNGLIFLMLICLAGETYYRNKVWQSEATIWEEATIKSPTNGRALMNFGLTKMAVGDYQTAYDYFKRAEKYNPNYYTLEINLGIVENALGRKGEAEQHFLRAIQLNQLDPAPQAFFAEWLLNESQNIRAIGVLQRGLTLDPTNLRIRHLLMRAYQSEWELVALKNLITETLAQYPTDPLTLDFQNLQTTPDYYLQQAGHFLTQSLHAYNAGKYEDTIHYAKKALEIRPDYPEAFNNLSAAYAKLANWELAVQTAEQALSLKPDFQLAKNNLTFALSQMNLPKN